MNTTLQQEITDGALQHHVRCIKVDTLQLRAENETLKQMVSTLTERAVRQDERSMEDIGYLSKILASRDEQKKKLRAEIETLKAENETLKSENAGLKEECDDWEAQYEEQLEIEEQEEEERQRESIASFKEKYCETDNDDDDDETDDDE